MTGSVQTLLAGGAASGVVPFTVRLDDLKNNAASSATMNFFSTGAITVLGSRSTTSGAWFAPVGGSPGTGYWIKAVITGAASSSGPASGALTPLTGTVGWAWNQSPPGTKSATAVVSIYSDAAGTQLQASASVTVSLDTGV